jgi:curved DNA-binding protein CbpA
MDARLHQYHPDRNRSAHTSEIVALIGEAGGVLGSRERRRVYDAELNRTGRPDLQSPGPEAADTSPRTTPSDAPELRPSQSPPALSLPYDSPMVLRLFGCGLIVWGGLFAWLSDQFRNHRGWLILLFWVCLCMGISCLNRAGQRLRGMSSRRTTEWWFY